jgi:hypothetical protein
LNGVGELEESRLQKLALCEAMKIFPEDFEDGEIGILLDDVAGAVEVSCR